MVGKEVREAVNTMHILPHSKWEEPSLLFMKRFSVCFEQDQVGIHFNIYPESPCSIHVKFLAIGIFHLNINSLYLLSFSRKSNWMDYIYSLLYYPW